MKKIIILFLTGCSLINTIHINENDISPYSVELNNLEPYSAPFVSTFSKNNFKLTYIAADHVVGIENSTCKTIKSAFANVKPKFLLIEGRAYTKINDETVLNYVNRCEAKNFADCGEDACALKEAIINNIPFNYAEPNDLSIKKEIIKLGYTEEELAFFYALRSVPQIKRQGNLEELETRKKTADFLERVSTKRLELKKPLTIEGFEKLYLSKMNTQINYSEITPDTVSPRIDRAPTWVNTLSHEVGIIREKFILKMINLRVNEYKNVMIVYGSGHLTKSRRALEKSFASVKNEKLFE